ncbi:hypothetical protein I9W82_005204 [Candida metapsilosis]|uniref:BED-type domain-containing protein n=1 Tax=Candida metapsilosis TaxID=273372 RepID=A0A8H7Z961_9ASCO|nr:hypothetical protein I9W82_005204 [Candida metapsilosis]
MNPSDHDMAGNPDADITRESTMRPPQQPFTLHETPFDYQQGSSGAPVEAAYTIPPTRFIGSTTYGSQNQHLHPQLQSPTNQEVVPVSNQTRGSLVYPSTQFNQYTGGTTFNQPRRPSLQSPSKSKRKRKNRPGKKFGAKKRSWVWSWFKQDSKNPNIAVCNNCMRAVVRVPSDKGSPKKLVEHLRTHGVTSGMRPSPGRHADTTHQYRDTQTGQHSTNQDHSGSSFTRQEFTRNEAPLSSGQQLPPQSYTFDTKLFYHHLLAFLIENQLPIDIIRSREFHEVVNDLRSEAVADLQELLRLYDSLIQVSQFGPGTRAFASFEDSTRMAVLSNALQRS